MSIDNSLINKTALKLTPHRSRCDLFDVIDYQRDILKYLKNVEVKTRNSTGLRSISKIFNSSQQSDKNFKPKPDYMKKQPDINDSMRTILVDWLVEVSEEYRLNSETLYLAVNYIDRFLSFMSVVRAKLQVSQTF
jgi:cyclin-A